MASASIIMMIGLPTVLHDVNITFSSIPYTIFALAAGSIFFGCLALILSKKMKSSEGFNTISNGLFLFFAFVSSAFYPAEGLPESLLAAFYVNPLTYVVDITRDGIFSQVDALTNIEVFILSLLSATVFLIATRAMIGAQV